MKYLSLALAVAGISSFSACKKNDKPQPEPEVVNVSRVTMIHYVEGSDDTTFFFYDENDNIIKTERHSHNDFEENLDKETYYYHYSGGLARGGEYYVLVDGADSAYLEYEFTYEYDAQEHLINERQFYKPDYNYRYEYIWEGDHINTFNIYDGKSAYNPEEKLSYTQLFSYDANGNLLIKEMIHEGTNQDHVIEKYSNYDTFKSVNSLMKGLKHIQYFGMPSIYARNNPQRVDKRKYWYEYNTAGYPTACYWESHKIYEVFYE